MATHHQKAFLDQLFWRSKGDAGHWRLLDALPCLDADHFGEELPDWKYKGEYRGDPVYFFKCLFNLHDGELLGVETEWEYGLSNQALIRECIHVQYARNQPQHNLMKRMHFPGTQAKYWEAPPEAAAMLTWGELENLGNTLVTRLDPPARKKGKVVTWPQLFHLGAIHNFTAMEIFGCGCHMELMMSTRDRSTGGHGRKGPTERPWH